MQPQPITPTGSRSESGGSEREASRSEAGNDVLSTIKTYTFDAFRLTSPPARLWRGDEAVDIRQRALHVLELLVSHAGSVVSRDDLKARLWGAEQFVDHEHGINTLMHEVRRVLGDDPQEPVFVETVRGAGYRFIAPTQVTEEPLFTRIREAEPKPRARVFRLWVLPVLSILAVIAGLAWGARQTLPGRGAGVVIRIEPMRGEVSLPLATDLCQTLGAHLDNVLATEEIGEFRIQVEHANGPRDRVDEVAGQPDLVVASTLHVLPDAYRIELELRDVDGGGSLWSHVYDVPAASLKMWPQLASKDLALELHRTYE